MIDGGRIALLAAITVGIVAACLLDAGQWLDPASIGLARDGLTLQVREDPFPTVAIFALLNIAALALSIPGAVLGFGLAAGVMFGPWWGMVLALASLVAGDSLAFLSARYLFRDTIERRFARQAARVNAGVARDGTYYLLSLRLLAVMPYFLVNWTMALTRMPLRLFAPVSFIGLIPITFVYVQAGAALGRVDSVGDLYSPRLLLALSLLALVPLAARFAYRRQRAARTIT